MNHEISSEWLTIEKVEEILNQHASLSLSEEAVERIEKCRRYLDEKMESQTDPIYGITTGFGSLCNISIDKESLTQLQKNLVMSHACGLGDRVAPQIVRLMLLLKIQSLSYGNSGVQLATVLQCRHPPCCVQPGITRSVRRPRTPRQPQPPSARTRRGDEARTHHTCIRGS